MEFETQIKQLNQEDLKHLQEEFDRIRETKKNDDTYSFTSDDIEFDLHCFIVDEELERRKKSQKVKFSKKNKKNRNR